MTPCFLFICSQTITIQHLGCALCRTHFFATITCFCADRRHFTVFFLAINTRRGGAILCFFCRYVPGKIADLISITTQTAKMYNTMLRIVCIFYTFRAIFAQVLRFDTQSVKFCHTIHREKALFCAPPYKLQRRSCRLSRYVCK